MPGTGIVTVPPHGTAVLALHWDHWRDKNRRNHCGTQGMIAGHTEKSHCHRHSSLSWINTLLLATDAVRWK